MKNKTVGTIFIIASLIYYLVALLVGISKIETGNSAVIWVCLGSSMLCLGSVYLNKDKQEKEQQKEEIKESSPKQEN